MDVRRERRPFLLAIAALCVFVWGVHPAMRGGDGLTAQYYDNPTWSGTPVHSGADHAPSTAQIRLRLGPTPPPAFSVVWVGYLAIGRSGLHTFATRSDDGSRLYVDGQLVVDNGGIHGVETRSGQLQLDRGPHRIRIEHEQHAAGYEMALLWADAGQPYQAVPAWALSRRPVQYGTALATRIVDISRWGLAILLVLVTAWYRRSWLALANIIVAAFAIAAASPFAPIVSTGFYEYQIHLGFVRGLQWGDDIVATYGPWGFVGLPMFHPATFCWMLLAHTLILTLTAFRIFVFVRRIQPPGARCPGLWSAAVILPLTVLPVAEWSPALYCFNVIAIAIAVEWMLGKAPTFAPADAIVAFLLGALMLVKISSWSIAPALICASWFQSRRHGLSFTGWFLFGALSAWLGAGQSLANVAAFVRLGLDVIGGFKDGLGMWKASGVTPLLFVVAAITPLVALALRVPPSRSGRWAGFIVPAAVFVQLFQAAFVRADGQHIMSNVLGFCAAAPLLVGAALSDGRWRALPSAAAIIIIDMLLFSVAPGSPTYSRPRVETRGLWTLVSERLSVLGATRERALAVARRNYSLPPELTAGSGAVFSGDIGVLEALAVAFQLEPTVASFGAYTRRLQELNARWLEHGGTQWALWCGPSAFDSRYPTELDGQALSYLATHFEYRRKVGPCVLLRRVSGPDWRAAATVERRAGFDQFVPIEEADGTIVWAELTVRETVLGKLTRMLLKPGPVTLRVFKRDATSVTREIVPSMTRQGFLLSPLVEFWDPLAAVAAGGSSSQQLTGLQVESSVVGRFSSSFFYHPEVTVRMTTLRSPRRPQ